MFRSDPERETIYDAEPDHDAWPPPHHDDSRGEQASLEPSFGELGAAWGLRYFLLFASTFGCGLTLKVIRTWRRFQAGRLGKPGVPIDWWGELEVTLLLLICTFVTLVFLVPLEAVRLTVWPQVRRGTPNQWLSFGTLGIGVLLLLRTFDPVAFWLVTRMTLLLGVPFAVYLLLLTFVTWLRRVGSRRHA